MWDTFLTFEKTLQKSPGTCSIWSCKRALASVCKALSVCFPVDKSMSRPLKIQVKWYDFNCCPRVALPRLQSPRFWFEYNDVLKLKDKHYFHILCKCLIIYGQSIFDITLLAAILLLSASQVSFRRTLQLPCVSWTRPSWWYIKDGCNSWVISGIKDTDFYDYNHCPGFWSNQYSRTVDCTLDLPLRKIYVLTK